MKLMHRIFTVQTLVRMADLLNAELGDSGPIFVCGVYQRHPNALAIISNVTGIVFDVFQSDDARSLYYATRSQLRRMNREVSQ